MIDALNQWLIRVLLSTLERLGWSEPAIVEEFKTYKRDTEAAERYRQERQGELMVLVDALVPDVARFDTIRSQSGEFKRHKVYAKALNLFPDTPRIDLSLAIEYALRKSRYEKVV